ncbi:MAG TPA: polyprenyl diphosphate synthase [Rhabdochlamydiaceae bacterium]|nr:polyprenyl diphosphate synthase [Rhabdochlamydiaceae bacterium]
MNSVCVEEPLFNDSNPKSKTAHSAFTPEEFAALDRSRIPQHVAIIMDGNRRWAKKHRVPYMVGHWKGEESLSKIVKAAQEIGIKVLTVYAFSTENWKRSPEEVEELMHLFKVYLLREREKMISNGVKLESIGNVSRFPQDVRDTLEETKSATAKGDKLELIIAVNYGGRDDIRRATLAIIQDCFEGVLSPNDLSEQVFSKYLDTAKWRDPELLIRTSGEQRISNFLLWQISYSEVYITPVLWPDFNERDLLDAVLEYQQRERRLGGS